MKARIGAVALTGIALAGTCSTVNAENRTDGNELLTQCQHLINAADLKKGYNPFQAGLCLGSVQAVRGTVDFLSDDLKNDSKFCIPAGVTNGQIARITVKFLKDYPTLLNQSQAGLIWLALTDAYPCK